MFVGVGSHEVAVELVERSLGEKAAAALERFQVKELVFEEARDGLDVALIGVGGGRDANVLAIASGARKTGALALRGRSRR